MIIPAGAAASDTATSRNEEEAFLLTRPVPDKGRTEQEARVGPAVLIGHDAPPTQAGNPVMRAAVRLLGNGDEDLTEVRRSALTPLRG